MRKILPPHAKISDDAKETIQECVSEYISFITGEANERCQREQRKTITAEDVLWTMSKLGFDDYIEPLTLYLHRYREMEGERGSSTTSLMRSESLAKGAGTSSGTSSSVIDHHQYYGISMAAVAAAFHHQHGHGFFGYMNPSDALVSNNNVNAASAAAASGSSTQLQGGGSAAMLLVTREPEKRKTSPRSGNGLEIERVELFLGSLVKKVMEQQEQMHKQLIEMVEKKEKERLAREEAWKQQELDRLKRDKEIRAQETSRNLALISFIQNYLGYEIQVPQPSPATAPERAPPQLLRVIY
ncbi:hypothetical protein EV2_005583 [Malus domestica]